MFSDAPAKKLFLSMCLKHGFSFIFEFVFKYGVIMHQSVGNKHGWPGGTLVFMQVSDLKEVTTG